jgi:2-iminobutanoate/2-iminopropanoate deaminase
MNISQCAGILSNVIPQLAQIPSRHFSLPSHGPRITLTADCISSYQEFSMNRRVWILFVALGLSTIFTVRGAFSQAEGQAKRRAINLPGPASQFPFSKAILAGDTLYLSGSIGLDPKTGKAPDKIEDEIKNLFDDYKNTLSAAGMSMDDLVFVQVFCTDLSLFDKFNAAYRAQFSKDFPARAFIGAGSILRGGHFEMQAIAVRH